MAENAIGIGIAVYLFISSILGCYVAYEKGRSQTEGFIFGLLFGPLGLLIVACLPTGDRPGRGDGGRVAMPEAKPQRTVEEEPKPVWLPNKKRRLLGEVQE